MMAVYVQLAALFIKLFTVSLNIILPLFNTATLSQVDSISPTIWVYSITILFSAILARRFLNLILSSGSNPAVGSSTIKTLGK